MSLTVSSSSMDLLHVSHCLQCLLAVSRCTSGPMEMLYVSHSLLLVLAVCHCLSSPTELLYVSHFLLLLLAVSYRLSYRHGVDTCLSLSLGSYGVAACISVSLLFNGCLSMSPWSCCMSLTVFNGCWHSFTVSPVSCSCYMSLIVAGCLSQSPLVPWSCCMSLTVSSSLNDLLHVSHCLL